MASALGRDRRSTHARGPHPRRRARQSQQGGAPEDGCRLAGLGRRKRRFGSRPGVLPVGVTNLLERDCNANEPETKWATEITEVLTDEGTLYLRVVLDLFSKRAAGWSMHHRQDRHMVVRAVQRTLWQQSGSSDVILHSDHRGKFISGTYQKFYGGNALLCGMTAVGHCADNAACEGFFGMLKRERVHHRRYRTRDEARADSSGFITRECVVDWPSEIGSSQS